MTWPAAAARTESAVNGGDQTINTPGTSALGSPKYSLDELVSHIELVYGSGLANEIAAATGANGSIVVAELSTPQEKSGTSDFNTILLNTRDHEGNELMDAFSAAMVLAHEYEHAKRLQDAGLEQNDPLTSDPLCGGCAHANMHYQQVVAIVNALCGDPGSLSPETHESYCRAIQSNLETGESKDCTPADCLGGHTQTELSRLQAQSKALSCCEG